MKRQTITEAILFVFLVVAGAQVRVLMRDLPNFAPVAAIALFAGFMFRSRLLAVCAPLGVMTISDLQIGGYDWRMMAVVYGCLVAPVAARDILRRYLTPKDGSRRAALKSVIGLVACSLAASLFFFVVTNFGSWMWFNTYEHSASGLAHCYVQAIPFFRYTLAGDLCFSVALFGGWAVAAEFGWTDSRRWAAAS